MSDICVKTNYVHLRDAPEEVQKLLCKYAVSAVNILSSELAVMVNRFQLNDVEVTQGKKP